MPDDWPRLCFVGPMVGRNPGWGITQAEVLADLFRSEGWTVRETSSRTSRPIRLIDTTICLIRWHRSTDVAVLSVFSGLGFTMAEISSLLTCFLRIPTVMVLHGGNLPTFLRDHPRRARRLLDRAQAIVAPTTFLSSVDVIGERSATVIPNVVDLAHITFRPRTAPRPRILWMRTFHNIYNPMLALRAFAKIVKERPDAVMTMAGQDKGLADDLHAEAQRSGLTEHIRFPGFLGTDAKQAALIDHDIFVNTNRVDNTPVSVIEAAAAGMAIVATNVGGIPHLLTDEETALLVPDDDEVAMAAAVERLLADPALAERLGRNARALALGSDWPGVRDRWISVLLDAARSGRRRRRTSVSQHQAP